MSATVEIVDNCDSNQLSEAGEEMLACQARNGGRFAMKRAEYPLAPLGDSASAVQLHGIQLMPGVIPDPDWDYARELQSAGRRVSTAYAAEIERLRVQYSHGRGGDRKSKSQVVILKEADGFHVKLREQLGLHPEQARRILQEAEYQRRIETVAKMEPYEVIEVPGKGKDAEPTPVEVTPRMIALAQQARETLGMPPAPKASRLWAGIAGEGARVDKRGKGSTERAPVNDGNNIAVAIAKLKNSLPALTELPSLEYNKLEEMWLRDVLPRLPERWLSSKGAQ